jgi:uncharacterized membrane protein
MTEPVPPVHPVPPGGTVSPNRNLMIVLAYLWILALVPLLVEKDDREVQWHAKHGIVLLVAEVIFWIAFTIVTNLVVAITFGLGCIIAVLGPIIGIALLALHIVAMVKGVNGQRLIIPYITQYADRF